MGFLLASWVRLGATAKPVIEGRVGRLLRWGTIGAGLAAPLALHARAAVRRRPMRRVESVSASLLVLGGGFLLRYVVVEGGRKSADDPLATFEFTALDHARSTH